jgi:peptide deformylase
LYTVLGAGFQSCLYPQPLDDSLFTSYGYSISLTVAFDVGSQAWLLQGRFCYTELMLLKIYQTGQPILRQKAGKVSREELASSETQQLIDYMVETLRDVPGVGLAAPQVGQPKQIFIIEDKEKYHKQVPQSVINEQGRRPVILKVFVNPQLELLETQDDMYFEGCLSVEGYVGVVARAKKVKVSALDRNGKVISYTADGWFARILQHEMGHLNGELYVDHIQDKSLISTKNFIVLWRDAMQSKIRKQFK